jgi:superfamily II DNA or RNA helicase
MFVGSLPNMPASVQLPEALRALNAHVRSFDPQSRSRGLRYVSDGRVQSLQAASDDTIVGVVLGGQAYDVQFRYKKGAWTSHCSCPLGVGCKHLFAAGRVWVTGGHRDSQIKPAGQGGAHSPGDPLSAAVEKALDRRLQEGEKRFLEKLNRIFDALNRTGTVRTSQLEELGIFTRYQLSGAYRVFYDRWWRETPKSALALWQYIAYDAQRVGAAIPAFMGPVTDTTEVEAEIERGARAQLVERWMRRLRNISVAQSSAADTTEIGDELQLRLRLGTDRWVIETRADADSSWKPASKAFLSALGAKADIAPGREFDPSLWSFLSICSSHYKRHYTLTLARGLPNTRELVHRLVSHRWAKELVKGPKGEPLQYSPQPLTWAVEPLTAEARDYTVSLVLPSGELLAPTAIHLGGTPDLYLHENTIYQGPPPLDGNSVASAVLPAEVVEAPEALKLFKDVAARLPEKIEQSIKVVPLKVRFECWIDDEEGRGEELNVRPIARSADGVYETGFGYTDWEPRADEGPMREASDGGAFVVLDRPPASEVLEWLQRLRLSAQYPLGKWTKKVTKNFAEEFVAWRASLPPHVEVFCTGELASLFNNPVRASLDVDLEEARTHRDWFDLALVLKPEDSTLTPEELRLLVAAKGKLVRLSGKGWRRLEIQFDDAAADTLGRVGLDAKTALESALDGEKHRFHSLQLADSGIAEVVSEAAAHALRARARKLVQSPAEEVPPNLKASLRPYQKDGFKFLSFLSANGLGGVLADDMGLGKTLQTLAWLVWLQSQQPADAPLRVLVVCPKSVVANWESETARFAPSLRTMRFDGVTPIPPAAHASDAGLLVITNYTQLRLNEETLCEEAWDAVILDEGQFIKNPSSKVAQTARALKSKHRLVLTGTPIENRLLDLWSLYAFALPGLLGSQASFKRQFRNDDPNGLELLRRRVRHFLLRRTKKQVATDLPPRTEEDLLVDLEGVQEKLYSAELKRARAELLGVQTDKQFDKARFNILASLLRLRQICCHPGLVDPKFRNEPSGKLDALMERIEELRDEGHQVLVFSQFVEMLELIKERLNAAGITHLLLTGQTENRAELVEKFQTDPSSTVFLLSLKAAGFGLNLTAAPYVILYDPWWNPAVEAQAIDRAHRIGQSSPVIAFRLITRGTVEEKIRALQTEKAAVAGAVVQEESLRTVLDLDTIKSVLG